MRHHRSHVRGQLGYRAVAALWLVVITLVLSAHSSRILLGWCIATASRGDAELAETAMSKLARMGEPGTHALLALATNTTPVRRALTGRYAALVPPDAVCDLALDRLRALREGPPAYRAFAFSAASSPYASYEEALAAWRSEELDAALGWYASPSHVHGRPASLPPRCLRPGIRAMDEEKAGQ